jgi:hypothetical protein
MSKKGKIMIRVGNENQEPMVVYVSHTNSFGLWVCDKMNTGDTLFSDDKNLVEFQYIKFKKMYYQWKIEHTERIKENFLKLLSELL